MTLGKMIGILRTIINDNPTNTSPRNSDTDLTTWINDARREISKDLKSQDVCIKKQYIMPELYIDEYSLNSDYMQSKMMYDTYRQEPCPPANKPIVESSKFTQDAWSVLGGNYMFIDENRRKILFYKELLYPQLEETYNVYSFDRTLKRIVIDGIKGTGTVSIAGSKTITGVNTLFTKELLPGCTVVINGETKIIDSITSDTVALTTVAFSTTASAQTMVITPISRVAKWNKIKAFARLTSAAGLAEYVRISRILPDTPSSGYYTLILSGSDLIQTYKDNLKCQGTVNLNSSVTLAGSGTYFMSELAAGESVLIGSILKTINTVSSNTIATVTNTYAVNSTGNTMYVSNLPTYADNDTIKFVSFVMDYKAQPDDLVYINQEDSFPLDVQELIPLKASIKAELYRGRDDYAARNENKYKEELRKVIDMVNSELADIHNSKMRY